jgi:triacylglycerol lipase
MNIYHQTFPRLRGALGTIAILGALAVPSPAQVPADIEAGLRKIGQIVDPGCTAKLYRPLMPQNDVNSSAAPLYPGITVARDVSFGPHKKDVVDIFTSDKGGANRTVLLYIPGGAGNKIELQDKEANAFYDNIGRWATKNGMVFVNMQRHPGMNWDDPAKDVSSMIQWVEANIAKYKGNPDRIFAWAQSAGNGPLGTYVGRPELYGPMGVGLKGVIFMSGQFNILPVQVPGGGRGPGAPPPGVGAPGSTCGGVGPNGSSEGALAGRVMGEPGGPNEPNPNAGPGGRGPAVPPEELLRRSTLPAYKETKVKIMLATAELDPGIDGQMSAFNLAFHDELCKVGPDHCPVMLFEKGESHMSEVFSIDTPDTTVSAPILAWIKKVK